MEFLSKKGKRDGEESVGDIETSYNERELAGFQGDVYFDAVGFGVSEVGAVEGVGEVC
jgi:hypothetical protein